jgi:hypothetical protein
MCSCLRRIIVPWVEKKRIEHQVPNSHAVLLFDCWSVHKSAAFLDWLHATYPLFHPVFIPAGCTGKAQPADVILQRPMKAVFMNEYTAWMTAEMRALLDAGATADTLRVDVGMVRMKPLLVKWLMTSWRQLRGRDAMIRKGWTTAGLGDVMNAEIQREAMRLVVSRQLALDAGGEGTEEDGSSAADAAEVQEEDDDDEYVEEDEEEIDVDVCLAACVEERPVVGERRSARLQAGSSERSSRHLAQLLQEQTEQQACYEDD